MPAKANVKIFSRSIPAWRHRSPSISFTAWTIASRRVCRPWGLSRAKSIREITSSPNRVCGFNCETTARSFAVFGSIKMAAKVVVPISKATANRAVTRSPRWKSIVRSSDITGVFSVLTSIWYLAAKSEVSGTKTVIGREDRGLACKAKALQDFVRGKNLASASVGGAAGVLIITRHLPQIPSPPQGESRIMPASRGRLDKRCSRENVSRSVGGQEGDGHFGLAHHDSSAMFFCDC